MEGEINIKVVELITSEESHLEKMLINDFKTFVPSYREGESIYIEKKDYLSPDMATEYDLRFRRYKIVEVVHNIRAVMHKTLGTKTNKESTYYSMEVYVRAAD